MIILPLTQDNGVGTLTPQPSKAATHTSHALDYLGRGLETVGDSRLAKVKLMLRLGAACCKRYIVLVIGFSPRLRYVSPERGVERLRECLLS